MADVVQEDPDHPPRQMNDAAEAHEVAELEREWGSFKFDSQVALKKVKTGPESKLNVAFLLSKCTRIFSSHLSQMYLLSALESDAVSEQNVSISLKTGCLHVIILRIQGLVHGWLSFDFESESKCIFREIATMTLSNESQIFIPQ